jgi:DNA-binding IclR family transcriptional regulator
MQELVETTDLTSHLAVLDKDQAVCIQKVEPPGLIQFDTKVGRRMDLHCSSLGKVILAHSGDDLLRGFLSKRAFARHTRKTISSSRALEREAAKVRRQRYAVDDQEEELEVRCVAVPVFNRQHEFSGALSVTGTTGQVPIIRIKPLVKILKQRSEEIFGVTVP